MRKAWKLAIALTLLSMTLSVAFPVQKAAACSCLLPENAAEAKERSAATFTGTVQSIGEFKSDRKEAYYAATLSVNESWKGMDEPETVVYTSWSSCQFDFEKGKTYLLYPYEHDGRYEVTNCGRSGEVMQANADVMKDLQELGAGMKFEAPPDRANAEESAAAEPERTRGLSWLPVTLGGVALIVIVVGGWIAIRGRKN
ncbi:hypothetical protein [Saccharibacillus endophyticus]|uniref:Tissue inhibitor of metalloproteinase n=1 Tax=Saccharibacillus endophyticus TaxID=2060666 RepID=A0ABQ1ZXR4_9BACL|nr:hypothetical protein [Saccharibacillus endophyticus]GGH79942.1 hypothetical protein GCM10007362_27500 [Saccharibacillus endophyticus]